MTGASPRKGIGKHFPAEHGAAEALERAGADKACRLAQKKNVFLPCAKVFYTAWTGDKAGLGFRSITKGTPQKVLQPGSLRIKSLTASLRLERAAKYTVIPLMDRPGIALTCFGIKNAGIIRHPLTVKLKP